MTRFDPELFRVYEPDECGNDGYPLNWHRVVGQAGGVKDMCRFSWDMRCERCGHPYAKGAGEWSACDDECFTNDRHRFDADTTRTRWEYDGESGDGIEIVEAHWRILTVHHLLHGHDAKRDLRWWNLTALCQRCHLTIQGRVLMDRVWPWEHTDWFKVHAAGFYAAAYEGRDITFEEAVERLDELLTYELQVTS